MSAVAREIIHALYSHPDAPPVSDNARLLLSSNDGGDKENDSFNESVKTILDSSLAVEEVEPVDLLQLAKDKENLESFDSAVLSNVLTGENAVEDTGKLSEILSCILGLMKPGGVAIIRENFEDHTADIIAEMTKFLDVFAVPFRVDSLNEKVFSFDFYAMNQLQDSIYAKSNFLDVYWTLTKNVENHNENLQILSLDKLKTYREFLDRTQYTEDNVKSYEWIFGDNFISPGGIAENTRILKYFRNLKPGQRMLDIGVGIGGGARQVAKEFGVHVLGCDMSSNMILHAFARNQRDKDHRVEYQIADATTYNFAENTFDAVFSRDCIQHIQHVDALFSNIFKWLKPGGEFLVTAYGHGYSELKPKFLKYVEDRQYFLKNLQQFREAAESVGFVNIYTENMTPRLEQILKAERQKAIDKKDEFVEKFSEKLFDKLIEGWTDKLDFIRDDNHNWLLLKAEKPRK